MREMYASLMPDLIGVRCTVGETIDLAQRHGFAGVDLRLNRDPLPTDEQARELRKQMDDLGLTAGYCSILPNKISVTADEWNTHRPHLEPRLDIAAALGFTRSTTVVLPFHEMLAFDEAMAEHVARLHDVLPHFSDRGLSLGLEYVSPVTRRAGQPHEFVHDLPSMLGLIDAAGNPANLGIMVDSFHWHCAGETENDLAALPAERIVTVHVCDAIAGRPTEEQVVQERELPGDSGVIDLDAFMRGLRRAGYTGPITAEPTHPRWTDLAADDACAETADAVLACLHRGR